MHPYNPTAFQQALYALLSDDATLSGMVEGIYSMVPEHTDFPYIFLFIEAISPYFLAGSEGVELLCSVSCFSQKPGQSELYAILERVVALLHDSQPEISGYHVANVRFTHSEFGLLSDGVTSRGTALFRAVLQVS